MSTHTEDTKEMTVTELTQTIIDAESFMALDDYKIFLRDTLTLYDSQVREEERENIREKIQKLTMIDEKYAHWAKQEILNWCFPVRFSSSQQMVKHTGTWSQCNDCFDGQHEKCVGLSHGCQCEHKSKLDQSGLLTTLTPKT